MKLTMERGNPHKKCVYFLDDDRKVIMEIVPQSGYDNVKLYSNNQFVGQFLHERDAIAYASKGNTVMR